MNTRVYGCGDNLFHQLGIESDDDVYSFTLIPGIENVKKIVGGEKHTLVLTSGGR